MPSASAGVHPRHPAGVQVANRLSTKPTGVPITLYPPWQSEQKKSNQRIRAKNLIIMMVTAAMDPSANFPTSVIHVEGHTHTPDALSKRRTTENREVAGLHNGRAIQTRMGS